MANFTGTLNSNEIFGALYNMIISQTVFGDNIKGTNSKLVDAARVDGSMYGDTKLYYATDVLSTAPWGADAEAANLLDIDRPAAPKCQAIKLDVFRQIRLTVDDYMSKRAWATEGAFSQFTSVMKGWMAQTKKVYDSTLYNTFVGSALHTSNQVRSVDVDVAEEADGAEGKARLEAQMVAQLIADIFTELKDINRINDYEYLRSYDESELVIVWNSYWANKISKVDLPTIYHADKVFQDFSVVLPQRYFGNKNKSAGTAPSGNTIVRAAIEKTFGVGASAKHCFPGDLLPAGAAYGANETYTEDASGIICKIMHKDSIPYMSAFEVSTSFFNPRSLTENNYLTFGHNTLEALKDKPFIVCATA